MDSTTVIEASEQIRGLEERGAVLAYVEEILLTSLLPKDGRPPLRTLATPSGVRVGDAAIREVISNLRAERLRLDASASDIKLRRVSDV